MRRRSLVLLTCVGLAGLASSSRWPGVDARRSATASGGDDLQTNECVSGPGESVIAPGMQEVDVFIRRAAALGAFSGTVLLARGDTILLHQGYGVASERPCILVGPETVHHIGSLAKQFAAAAVLALLEEERLQLEDPIGRFLPDVPRDKRAITIHHLLTHTSGLPADLFGYGALPDPGRARVMERILSAELESVPGVEYRYSNAGYTLLTMIVEIASGQSFEDFLHSVLLEPAGLERTGFVGDSLRFGEEDVALGFWGRYSQPSPRGRDLRWTSMPGEVLASSGDLYRWFRALQGGEVLGAESVEAMFTAQAAGYGYGWHVRSGEDGSTGVVFHNGDAGEYAAALRYYPRTDLTAIALTNLVVQDAKQHDDILNNALEIMAGAEPALPSVGRTSSLLPATRIPAEGGGIFSLDTDVAGREWLAPETCTAVGSLFAHLDGVQERCRTEIEKTIALAETLAGSQVCLAEDREALPVQLLIEWKRLPCDLRSRLGPLRAIEGVAARPLSWTSSRALAWTRHIHRDGAQLVTWLWEGDDLVEVWTSPSVPEPHAVRIAAIDDSTRVMFDWFAGTPVPIRIRRAGEEVTQIRVGGAPR